MTLIHLNPFGLTFIDTWKGLEEDTPSSRPFWDTLNRKPNFSPFYLCEVFVSMAPSVSAWFKHQPAARKSPVSMSCNRVEQLLNPGFHDQSLGTAYCISFCCFYWPSKDVFLFQHWIVEHYSKRYKRISWYKEQLSYPWKTISWRKGGSSSRVHPHKTFEYSAYIFHAFSYIFLLHHA